MKIGGMELLVVLIVALIVIGPERLPKAARSLGKMVGQFNKAVKDATSDLRDASDEFKVVTDTIGETQKMVKDAFKETEEDLKKTGKETEDVLNGKKKKPDGGEKTEPKPAAAQESAAEAEESNA